MYGEVLMRNKFLAAVFAATMAVSGLAGVAPASASAPAVTEDPTISISLDGARLNVTYAEWDELADGVVYSDLWGCMAHVPAQLVPVSAGPPPQNCQTMSLTAGYGAITGDPIELDDLYIGLGSGDLTWTKYLDADGQLNGHEYAYLVIISSFDSNTGSPPPSWQVWAGSVRYGTTATITASAFTDGVIKLTVTGATFRNFGVMTQPEDFNVDFEIDTGTTGLSVAVVTYMNSTEVWIYFDGARQDGTVTIQAKGSAFDPTANVPRVDIEVVGVVGVGTGSTPPPPTLPPLTPPPYTGPMITPPAGVIAASAGGKVTIPGSRLGDVSKVEIAGLDAEITVSSDGELSIVVPRGLAAGVYDLVIVSASGKLTIQGAIRVTGSAAATSTTTGEARPSTRLIAENSMKVWVFDAVGAGKVQIMLNGREVAWVNAASADDPKLRDGRLVRTLTLAAGKNVIEIYVDGERVSRRVATGS